MTIEYRSLFALVALFFLVFFACLYGIEFPTYWHPDEFGKFIQLRSGRYTFFHPQLLLQVTSAVTAALSITSENGVIVAGRVVSAVSVAVACFCFALFVARRFGLVFGLAAGLLVGLSPTVFASGHYLKEDAILLMGIALSMLAIQNFDKEPSVRASLLLGAAVGIACSAKYVGVVMVIPAAVVLVQRRSPISMIIFAAAIAAVTFGIVNYSAFLPGQNLYGGLSYELTHVATAHRGVKWGATSPRTLLHYWANTSLIALSFLLIGVAVTFRRMTTIDFIVCGMPIVWLALVQLSAVSFVRYTMPAIALTAVGGVWFAAKLSEDRRDPRISTAILLVLGVAGLVNFVDTSKLVAALNDNARDRAVAWIKNNLPAESVVASDFYSGLPTPSRLERAPSKERLPQRLTEIWNVARIDTVSGLVENGVTHLSISSSGFSRYFDPYVTLSPERGALAKKFYVDLFSQYTPIHIERGALVSDEVISSDIFIFDLRK